MKQPSSYKMKTLVLAFGISLAFCTMAMTADIACSTMTNRWWWSEATAEREMQEIADSVSASVEVFTSTKQDLLADWVAAHIGNGQSDLLILCGSTPHTIYPGGNARPDGSLVELFLDDGNCIINTGDWMFYGGSGGHNGERGLQNVMDIPGIRMLNPNEDMTPTTEGQLYTPSLEAFTSPRPWNLNELTNDWEVELILGQNADGTGADPAIVVNTVTGGRLGVFLQVAEILSDERSVVISEWINNWYLKYVSPSGGSSDPVPEDGAVDVRCDINLNWKAGAFPATYDVYFGMIWEDVNSGSGEVVTSLGQLDTSFDPGRLEFDTPYFWRVDEVTDTDMHRGAVWSFTVESFAYPLAPVLATSSSNTANMGPENTINGIGINELDQHSTLPTEMWLSGEGDSTPWIQYEFDKAYRLHEMWVWNSNQLIEPFLGLGTKDVLIEYSTDGAVWTPLEAVPQFAQATGTADYAANTIVDLTGALASFIRITVNTGWGMLPQYGLSEVRFFYVPTQARTPMPADGAVDVRPDAVLAWGAGREADQSIIYVDVDGAAVAAGTAASLSSNNNSVGLGPLDLQMNPTYYWRVDEVNNTKGPSVWEGPVWRFNTATLLTVEDFESYTNFSPNRPFQHWLDGAGYPADDFLPVEYEGNGTDAVVGHGSRSLSSPPFEGDIIETSDTIPDSDQALPFYYNNAGGASFTEHTFAEPQDWTVGGVKTLSIAWKGQAANTGTLFAVINDTKISFQGNSLNSIARPVWQNWYIDLGTLNTTLSHISKLQLGVEGDGSGLILFDDIRLHPEPIELFTLDTGDVTSPGDPLLGLPNDGNWPLNESPDRAIDNNVRTKYLHRKGGARATGFSVEPMLGATIVTGLSLTTANDVPSRDPISFELSGSNTSIVGPYTLIASGDVLDFAGTSAWPRFTQNETPIQFDNTLAYQYFQIVFPTLRGANEALMQIAEVELLTTP
jgi:hypothetical protein